MMSLRSAGALVAAAAVLALTGAFPQAAHAHPGGAQAIGANPMPEQVLTTSIDTVEVTFSAPIRDAGNSLAVFNPNGRQINTGDPRLKTPTTLETSIKPLKDAGTYTVNFTAAATGHPASGAYEFRYNPPADKAGSAGVNAGLIGLGAVIVLAALGAAIASVLVARRRASTPPTRGKRKATSARA